MKRCIVITAYIHGSIDKILSVEKEDFIICADGGYEKAFEAGILADAIIGDFDSVSKESKIKPQVRIGGEILHFPVMKDETDTLLCLKYGIEHGFDTFLIVGGIGGRFDHTMANLQCLNFLTAQNKFGMLLDEFTRIEIHAPGTFELKREAGFYFSIFSMTPESTGVTIKGGRYPLWNATLKNTFPLGVSNEFMEASAFISFTSGSILSVLTKEK